MISFAAVLASLPWLVLAACPLAMWWMMRGMKGHEHRDRDPEATQEVVRLRSRVRELEDEVARVPDRFRASEPR